MAENAWDGSALVAMTLTSLIAMNNGHLSSNIVDQGKVWSPVLGFSNHVDKEGAVLPLQSEMFVVREKPGDLNSNEELVMKEIYSGKENPFQKKEVYQLDLNCAFANLSRYPFDVEI